jgi:hypothetical protein
MNRRKFLASTAAAGAIGVFPTNADAWFRYGTPSSFFNGHKTQINLSYPGGSMYPFMDVMKGCTFWNWHSGAAINYSNLDANGYMGDSTGAAGTESIFVNTWKAAGSPQPTDPGWAAYLAAPWSVNVYAQSFNTYDLSKNPNPVTTPPIHGAWNSSTAYVPDDIVFSSTFSNSSSPLVGYPMICIAPNTNVNPATDVSPTTGRGTYWVQGHTDDYNYERINYSGFCQVAANHVIGGVPLKVTQYEGGYTFDTILSITGTDYQNFQIMSRLAPSLGDMALVNMQLFTSIGASYGVITEFPSKFWTDAGIPWFLYYPDIFSVPGAEFNAVQAFG